MTLVQSLFLMLLLLVAFFGLEWAICEALTKYDISVTQTGDSLAIILMFVFSPIVVYSKIRRAIK